MLILVLISLVVPALLAQEVSYEGKLEKEQTKLKESTNIPKGSISFDQYHTFDVISDYLKEMALTHKHVRLHSIGYSFEGRPIWMLRIGFNAGKPAILVEGGIHAREWISPPVALYIIQQLLDNPEYTHMYQDVEWQIIPVLNPDGYEYSHTTDRNWRKNRRPGTNTECYGVDLNRNFDFFWEQGVQDECSNTYRGPTAFSEPEIRAVRNHILTNPPIKLYISFHSHCPCILYSWGYTSDLPEDAPELQALGERAGQAIASKFGTTYKVGSSFNVLNQLFGGAKDWAKAVAGINMTYTVEMPGGGEHGYDLPADQIEKVVTETWDGVIEWHKYVQEKYGPE